MEEDMKVLFVLSLFIWLVAVLYANYHPEVNYKGQHRRRKKK